MQFLTNQIWEWFQKKDKWLSTTRIPGKLNVEADLVSYKNEIHIEVLLQTDRNNCQYDIYFF